MTNPLLLDTCAAIWLVIGESSLSQSSRDSLGEARMQGVPIAISPITAWEIGLLNSKGRMPLLTEPGAWFRSLIALPGLMLAPLNPEILIQSSFLPGSPPRDPADRIITATARTLGYRIVTRDRLLLDYAEAGHVEALAC